MKRFCLFLIFALALVPYGWAVGWVDPFLLAILFFTVLLWVGLPIVVGAGLTLLFALGRRRASERLPRMPFWLLGGVGIYAVLGGGTIYLNGKIHEHLENRAKAYPIVIAPLLEEYRQTHGHYPERLSEVPSCPPLPRLLKDSAYRSDGRIYSFSFMQPGSLFSAWFYDSQTGRWVLAT